MRVIFRTDASIQIGAGHVMRCLVLAEMLQKRGVEVQFVCREHEGDLNHLIEQEGYKVNLLSMECIDENRVNHEALDSSWVEDAEQTYKIISSMSDKIDWLIVDHYGLDICWENLLRPLVGKMLIIDDLVNRSHNCDLLLDQNLHHDAKVRYQSLVPSSAHLFLGPNYALLRKEFAVTSLLRRRNGRLKKMLVYFGGGAGIDGQVLELLNALRLMEGYPYSVTIVLGLGCTSYNIIANAALDLNGIKVLKGTNQMAQLISEADLAIGACGTSAWERCLLGLPSIVIVTAENQREDAEILENLGAVKNLGHIASVKCSDYVKVLESFHSNREILKRMEYASLSVMSNRKNTMLELNAALFR